MSTPIIATLMKRFPNSSEEDVQDALLAADGHGGKAASILMGRPIEAALGTIGEAAKRQVGEAVWATMTSQEKCTVLVAAQSAHSVR